MPNKPIGQVEIDWGHPLAEGLRGCYLFNDTYDLVSHEKVTLRGDSILDGTGNLVVDSSLSFPINDGAYTSTKSVHNGELSVVADITLRSSGLNQQIYSADSNDSNKREWQFRISGTNNVQFIPFVNNSNDPATGSTALTVGNRYTVGCTHNKTLSTNNVVVYLNGMQDGVDTNPGSLDDDGALKCIGIRTKTITPTIFTEAASHKFNYIYHWDRALSAEEIQSLHQDPYQFLKPVKTVQEQAYAALFSAAAGSGAVTGTSAVIVDDVTINATGIIIKTGTANVTVENVIVEITGVVSSVITGNVSVTVQDVTVSAIAEREIVGTANTITELVTTIIVAEREVTGTSAYTIEDVSVSASGYREIKGDSVSVVDTVTLSATGSRIITGVANGIIEDIAVSVLGSILGEITGIANILTEDVTVSATGIREITGIISSDIDDVTVTAIGVLGNIVTGTIDATITDINISAVGTRIVTGNSVVTIEGITTGITANRIIVGSSIITVEDVTVTGYEHTLIIADARLLSLSGRNNTFNLIGRNNTFNLDSRDGNVTLLSSNRNLIKINRSNKLWL